MTREEVEYAVIKNLVTALAVLCAANEDKIISLLTNYLWDEEEAGEIRSSDGKFKVYTQEEE